MPRETTEDIVVVRDRINKLRTTIDNLANKLRNHIGATGNAHVLCTYDHPGFMPPEVYKKLLGYQDRINTLRNKIESLTVPDGAMLWWWGNPTEIPDGYVLVNGQNNTVNLSDKYVMGIKNDSELGKIAGTSFVKYSELPTERHRHSFRNEMSGECWDEVQGSPNSNSNMHIDTDIGGGQVGSGRGGNVSSYPWYKQWTTNTAGQSSSSSGSGFTIQPPYVALNAIKKIATKSVPAADALGDLHIIIGKKMPEGILECNGQSVSSTVYSALTSYVTNLGLTLTAAEYTSMLNTYDCVPYFVLDENAGTLRLPTIRNVLSGMGSDNILTKEVKPTELPHYHGLGSYDSNNGYWGYLPYTNAPYPEECTGGNYWNGNGNNRNHGGYDIPVNGEVITSLAIYTGSLYNGIVCDSLDITIGIRAYHPEYTPEFVPPEPILPTPTSYLVSIKKPTGGTLKATYNNQTFTAPADFQVSENDKITLSCTADNGYTFQNFTIDDGTSTVETTAVALSEDVGNEENPVVNEAQAMTAMLVEDAPNLVADSFTVSEENYGWRKLADGLLTQYGKVQVQSVLNSDYKTATITFPISYENTPFHISVSTNNPNDFTPCIVSSNASSFTVNLGKSFELSDTLSYKVIGV